MMRLLFLLLLFALPASAANSVYIAQTSAGGNTGADCLDAKPVTYFNTSGNWSATPTGIQIGPGTAVHLCGTFTGTAGSTMLTIQGSGASNNPVTIIFEANAQLSAPYWGTSNFTGSGAAIVCSNFNYITVNGGVNGLIANTANGTVLANQAGTTAVNFSGCNHVTITQLNVSNMYVKTSASDEGQSGGGATGIAVGSADFLTITNNVVKQVRDGIDVGYITLTSATITGNTVDYGCHLVTVGDILGNSTASGVVLSSNTIGPHQSIWGDPSQNCHGDGFILSAFNSGSVWSNSTISNNNFSSDMCALGGNCTAPLFLTGDFSNIAIYNNVLSYVNAGSGNGGGESLIRMGVGSYTGAQMTNMGIYNNTFTGLAAPGIKIDADPTPGFIVKNNIFVNMSPALLENPTNNLDWAASDYNDFYNSTVAANGSFSGMVTNYNTLASWQVATISASAHPDPNSITGNPLLNAFYIPQPGSAAIGAGANLTSLAITALDADAIGIPRPATGPWVIGAYNSGLIGIPGCN
jgi:hypothetical protein